MVANLLIYLVLLWAIIDTMRKHDIFKKEQKNINLYLFYTLSIIVCFGRYMTIFSVLLCSVLDDGDFLDYFNYGFYTATFSIMLIAFSQINSINTATLRARYINKHYSGQKPEISRLNKRLFWINIVNGFIDFGILTYFTISMAQLVHYSNTRE
jgi:hypothetical protein